MNHASLKIVTIIGARPQFIKAASVSRAIERHNRRSDTANPRIKELIIHTGQHYDATMSNVFFKELKSPKPDYLLNINNVSHGAMTGRMIEKIEKILIDEAPDVVLVYGDTNSTLAGALAAAKLNIPVAHCEAGLRSFSPKMPEERNRVLTDHCSDILLCPTATAVKNLKREGIEDRRLYPEDKRFHCHVEMVGDVMYDSVIANLKLAQKKSRIMESLFLIPKKYVLATIHRAENTDHSENLRKIFYGLEQVSKLGLKVILPLHPRTRNRLQSIDIDTSSISLIPPLSYLDMLIIEKNAHFILTDSGGIQKEAYWLKVPCVTLRLQTEWVETVDAGWNVLVGVETDKILSTLKTFERPDKYPDVFGNGRAAEKIVATLNEF